MFLIVHLLLTIILVTEDRKKESAVLSDTTSSNKIDISLDPQQFLKIDAKSLTQVSADLVEKIDEFDG